MESCGVIVIIFTLGYCKLSKTDEVINRDALYM